MKLLDKLKNIFFEEVEEEEEEEEIPQTFAKKVEIPKKVIKEPEKKEKNIEISSPKEEIKKEEKTEIKEEKEVIKPKVEEEKEFPMMFDDDDFFEDVKDDVKDTADVKTYRREDRNIEEKELYPGKKEMSYIESVNSKPVTSYTKTYYEEKEKKLFKPSPIISPIYGILDQNYRKEEIITKRETKIVSSSTRPDLDSIRNKAFGSEEKSSLIKEKKEEKKSNDNDIKIYDVNNNKPQVNHVTIADADEYYNDLGLAYNEDYSDASRNTTRTNKYNSRSKKKNDNDDNLFDLIDSMYNKEE